jgi:MFS superfamily sulfate permease-like transporter
MSHSNDDKNSFLKEIPQNFLSGLVVFIIALPLSLGVALASNMPPVTALVSSVIGGVLVGIFTGSPLMVSGPAAGLSAMVLGFVNQFGVEGVFKITLLAGIFQMILGICKMGKVVLLIPKTVLEGVLSAIGLIILIGQCHILLGQSIPGAPIQNLLGLPHALMVSFSPDSVNLLPFKAAALIGFMGIFVQILWPLMIKKALPKLSAIPSALPAVSLGTAITLIFNFDIPKIHLVSLTNYVAESFSLINWTNMTYWSAYAKSVMTFLVPATGLALVASAESLLTARSLDVLISLRHKKIPDQLNLELFAQGLGNFTAGLLRGMPITGVMVRSVANLDANATNRLSTIFHGLLLGFATIFFPQYLEKIPLAILASLLVFTGWKLLNLNSLFNAMKNHPKEAYMWPATMIAIFATDLLTGFIVGLVLGLIDHFIIKKYVVISK